jgi:hypothetical protein
LQYVGRRREGNGDTCTVITAVAFYGAEGHTTPRAADLQIVVDATIVPFRTWLTP